jgi:hypothetical protein
MIRQYTFLLLLSSGNLICQPRHRLTDEPVAVQKDFFSRFILTGVCGDATTTCEELVAVARTSKWVVQMLEPSLLELREDEQANRKRFLSLLYMLVSIGNIDSLDVVIRVLDKQPEKASFVRSTLLANMDGPLFNNFDLWYHALDHYDSIVREAAEEIVLVQIDHPSEQRRRMWADSALRRYGHPPADSDWKTDPMMMIFSRRHPAEASEKQRQITAIAEEIKKQNK